MNVTSTTATRDPRGRRSPDRRGAPGADGAPKARRKRREKLIELVLLLAACVSVFTTVGIVYVLVKESLVFFSHVPLWDFLTDTPVDAAVRRCPLRHHGAAVGHADQLGRRAGGGDSAGHHHRDLPVRVRRPQDARDAQADARTAVAACRPSSTATSRCCSSRRCCRRSFPELPGFNVLSAGLVMGIMIIPYVSSLSEDAMRAVPMSLREGSYAMGATRFQTARQGGGAGGALGHRRRPTSSASRAPSARR